MNKKVLWSVVSALMVLSLVIAACAPAAPTAPTIPATPATPSAPIVPAAPTAPTAPVQEKPQQEAVKPITDVPRYGGTLTLAQAGDESNWDPGSGITGQIRTIIFQHLWEGDWSRGPAGGYGTGESDWLSNSDIFELKAGRVAENWKWTADFEKDEGTLVYQIRRGIHYALNPALEASRLVNGRELTADDVVYHLKRNITDPATYIWGRNLELRPAKISKTGPWEVTIKVPMASLMSAISRFGDAILFYPSELDAKYGNVQKWQTAVGTGAFMVSEYVAGGSATLLRNPNYWEKDPVGPGKGNQLPYLDRVKMLIIPDASTRMAALRTGKVDHMANVGVDDADQLLKTAPGLKYVTSPSHQGRGTPAFMRIDKKPFDDVRVRRAMNMAIDREAILQSLFKGRGQIMTWPYSYVPDYAGIVVTLDDSTLPAAAKEVFSYNPEKAKQLLKEAGYPNGFKTEILLVSSEVDYYAIVKDYLSKIGVDLTLDVKESGTVSNIRRKLEHQALIPYTTGPAATWWQFAKLSGLGTNFSMINDPVINEALEKVMRTIFTDEKEAMRLYKELIKNYVLEQAYVIPSIEGNRYYFWWPWLKNYSGEMTIGYDDYLWPFYIWYDSELKKSMGY